MDGKPLNRQMADFRVTPGALLPFLASVFFIHSDCSFGGGQGGECASLCGWAVDRLLGDQNRERGVQVGRSYYNRVADYLYQEELVSIEGI